MSMSDFRNLQTSMGHTVEVDDETHLDINGKPVRTVVYRSKDFKGTTIEEELGWVSSNYATKEKS